MSIGTYIAIYFVVWWTVIFAVLPWGVRSQAEEGKVIEGTEPAAPARPALVRKAIATTIVSALLVGLFAWAVETGRLRLDMFPLPFEAR